MNNNEEQQNFMEKNVNKKKNTHKGKEWIDIAVSHHFSSDILYLSIRCQ